MNMYYDPEKFGLETIGEIDWSDGCYQFDLTVVWKRTSDGKFVYAEDSGCSCPSPFEDTGIEDPELDPARIAERNETAREVAAALPALTELQRQAVVLHHLEQMRLKATAELLDTDVSSLKSVLHRARGTMRRVLADA